jgi:acyl carrier protein
MGDTISQQVIDFTADYTGQTPIETSTTLASIGIAGGQDTVQYTMELEDNFQLTYNDGDANGIVTVGNAITLIRNKMGA